MYGHEDEGSRDPIVATKRSYGVPIALHRGIILNHKGIYIYFDDSQQNAFEGSETIIRKI